MKKRRVVGLILVCLAAAAALLLLPRIRGFFGSSDGPAPSYTGFFTGSDGLSRYYENGRLCDGLTGLAGDAESGWRYVENGVEDPGFTGFAANSRGWWYVEDGRAALDRSGLIGGRVAGEDAEWYVTGGRVRTDYTGLAQPGEGEALRYVEDGRAASGFTGFAQSAQGWWYVENGAAATALTGVVEGTVGGEEAFWYVENGQVALSFRGLADCGEDGLLYVMNGRAFPELNGLAPVDGEMLFFENGRFDSTRRCPLASDGADWIVIDGRASLVSTDDERMLFLAMRLAETWTDESMDREEKLAACFRALIADYKEINNRVPHYYGLDWPAVYAADLFIGGAGNCFSFAAAFGYLARAVGYENVYACNSSSHGWTEIDGLIYDAEWSKNNPEYPIYALSYDSATGEFYTTGMGGCEEPQFAWKRIKL